MDDRELQVGDVVADIVHGFGNPRVASKHTISRVTATQAIVESCGIRFERKISRDGFIRKRGRDTWSRRYWQLVTEEIQESIDTAMRIQTRVAVVRGLIRVPLRQWSESQLDGVIGVFEAEPHE